ncbi:DMT family transporter [Pseudoalteromonas luteoviolacea]|uniref:DMT family transporter n=1 Tax=Pseudoalteromonas luteoviolacea TaxID=43657 RepID=UPI001152CADF|nr:DMT family transporter [Pseudoalteromonas luteoviolacea]TQF66664.1 DMT family transporter [Pseudoalteromonas luteoviolacea]
MHSTYFHTALLLLWVSLLASSFIVSEQVLPYASPIAATWLRFFLTSLCLIPIVGVGASYKIEAQQLLKYAVISLFLVLFFVGLFESLRTTTAQRTAIIYTFLPVMCVILSYLLMNIVPNTGQLWGFMLGILGATWTVSIANGNATITDRWFEGDSIFLLSCFSLAIHVVLAKKWASTQPALISTFFIVSLGCLLLLPSLFLSGNLQGIAWSNSNFWLSIIYLTLFTTLGTFFLQQYLLKHLNPNAFLAATYLVPTLVLLFQGLSQVETLLVCTPAFLITLLALYFISRDT